jgi:hypothetical protein
MNFINVHYLIKKYNRHKQIKERLCLILCLISLFGAPFLPTGVALSGALNDQCVENLSAYLVVLKSSPFLAFI